MREGTKSGTGKKFVNKGYNRMSYMERKKKQAERGEDGGQHPEVGGKKTGYTPQGEGYRTTRGPKKKAPGAGYKPADTGEKKAYTGNKPAYSKPLAGRSGEGNKPFPKTDSQAAAKRPAAPAGKPAYSKPSESSSYAKAPVDKRSKISISKPGAETTKPAAGKAASNIIPSINSLLMQGLAPVGMPLIL
ncbi:hypothetical protein [Paraflavitalea speifideaquila]|uniref:hypothetical protein n=1 Tax=Paraflavitalea speifideaquila TaxID=3076558 RepID=UPI0028EDE4CE|nr:hypothetical protein [Paraflavitalea speifideiaquila]